MKTKVYCDFFQRTILRRMLTEVNVYDRHNQCAKFACLEVSKVIDHKSHETASFMLGSVNIMLESLLKIDR